MTTPRKRRLKKECLPACHWKAGVPPKKGECMYQRYFPPNEVGTKPCGSSKDEYSFRKAPSAKKISALGAVKPSADSAPGPGQSYNWFETPGLVLPTMPADLGSYSLDFPYAFDRSRVAADRIRSASPGGSVEEEPAVVPVTEAAKEIPVPAAVAAEEKKEEGDKLAQELEELRRKIAREYEAAQAAAAEHNAANLRKAQEEQDRLERELNARRAEFFRQQAELRRQAEERARQAREQAAQEAEAYRREQEAEQARQVAAARARQAHEEAVMVMIILAFLARLSELQAAMAQAREQAEQAKAIAEAAEEAAALSGISAADAAALEGEINERLRESEEVLEANRLEVANAEARLDELQAVVTETSAALELLTADITRLNAERDMVLTYVAERLATEAEKAEQIAKTKQEYEQAIANATADLESLNQQKIKLDEEVRKVQERIASERANSDLVEKEVRDLELQKSSLGEDVSILRQRRQMMETQAASLTLKVKNLSRELEELVAKHEQERKEQADKIRAAGSPAEEDEEKSEDAAFSRAVSALANAENMTKKAVAEAYRQRHNAVMELIKMKEMIDTDGRMLTEAQAELEELKAQPDSEENRYNMDLLASLIRSLEPRIASNRQAYTLAYNNLMDCEKEMLAEAVQLEELKNQKVELAAKLAQEELVAGDLKEQVKSLQNALAISSRIDDEKSNADHHLEELKTLREEVKAYQAKVKGLESNKARFVEIDEEKEDMRQRLADLTALQDKVASQAETIKALSVRNLELSVIPEEPELIAVLVESNRETVHAISDVEKQLRADLAAMKRLVPKYEAEVTDLTQSLGEMTTAYHQSVKEAKTNAKALADENARHLEEMKRHQAEMLSLVVAEAKDKQATVEKMEGEIQKLNTKLAQSEKAAEEAQVLQEELEELNNRIAEWEIYSTALEHENEEVNTILRNKEKAYRRAMSRVGILEHRVKALKKHVSRSEKGKEKAVLALQEARRSDAFNNYNQALQLYQKSGKEEAKYYGDLAALIQLLLTQAATSRSDAQDYQRRAVALLPPAGGKLRDALASLSNISNVDDVLMRNILDAVKSMYDGFAVYYDDGTGVVVKIEEVFDDMPALEPLESSAAPVRLLTYIPSEGISRVLPAGPQVAALPEASIAVEEVQFLPSVEEVEQGIKLTAPVSQPALAVVPSAAEVAAEKAAAFWQEAAPALMAQQTPSVEASGLPPVAPALTTVPKQVSLLPTKMLGTPQFATLARLVGGEERAYGLLVQLEASSASEVAALLFQLIYNLSTYLVELNSAVVENVPENIRQQVPANIEAVASAALARADASVQQMVQNNAAQNVPISLSQINEQVQQQFAANLGEAVQAAQVQAVVEEAVQSTFDLAEFYNEADQRYNNANQLIEAYNRERPSAPSYGGLLLSKAASATKKVVQTVVAPVTFSAGLLAATTRSVTNQTSNMITGTSAAIAGLSVKLMSGVKSVLSRSARSSGASIENAARSIVNVEQAAANNVLRQQANASQPEAVNMANNLLENSSQAAAQNARLQVAEAPAPPAAPQRSRVVFKTTFIERPDLNDAQCVELAKTYRTDPVRSFYFDEDSKMCYERTGIDPSNVYTVDDEKYSEWVFRNPDLEFARRSAAYGQQEAESLYEGYAQYMIERGYDDEEFINAMFKLPLEEFEEAFEEEAPALPAPAVQPALPYLPRQAAARASKTFKVSNQPGTYECDDYVLTNGVLFTRDFKEQNKPSDRANSKFLNYLQNCLEEGIISEAEAKRRAREFKKQYEQRQQTEFERMVERQTEAAGEEAQAKALDRELRALKRRQQR